MSRRPDETGIEELRKLVNMANNTREDAFDGLDAFQVVRLLQACRALDLEVLPDDMNDEERLEVANTGKVPTETLELLYEAANVPKGGRDWEGR
jgi:hypothetical protein